MASPYKVFIRSISCDGTSLFCEIEVFDGLHTLPTIRPSFLMGTTASEIRAYCQNIVDNQPTLDPDLGRLVGTFVG